MNTEYRSAQHAAKSLANYYLLENWTAPTKINIGEIRELRDNLTVIDFYLKRKREEIEARLLDSTHEYQCEIRNGNMGNNVSAVSAWRDYELSIDEEDGKLVAVVDGSSCSGETNSMQFS